MAKRKVSNGPNKTALIRKELEQTPNASPSEIAEKLSAKGADISAAYVSTIKSTLKRRAGGAKRPRVSKNQTANGHVAVDALIEAKSLIDKAGGVDEAKKVLDVLSKLH